MFVVFPMETAQGGRKRGFESERDSKWTFEPNLERRMPTCKTHDPSIFLRFSWLGLDSLYIPLNILGFSRSLQILFFFLSSLFYGFLGGVCQHGGMDNWRRRARHDTFFCCMADYEAHLGCYSQKSNEITVQTFLDLGDSRWAKPVAMLTFLLAIRRGQSRL